MILKTLKSFWEYYAQNVDIEIYNEFSFQHELGIYIRNNMPGYKVQFERNANHFININNANTIKKEIDIVVFDSKEKFAIELKYPRHGQYPVRMFNFIEDIQFMEELKHCGFDRTFVITIVDKDAGKNFYSELAKKNSGIYSYFRSGGVVPIHGDIAFPCNGKIIRPLSIKGSYTINWTPLPRGLFGYILEIDNSEVPNDCR